MDGLIIDSEPIYKMAWRRACNEHGFELSDEDHTNLKGRGRKSALIEVQKHAARLSVPLDLGVFVPTLNKYEALYFGSEPVQSKIGLLELLDFLDQRKIPCAVATSASKKTALHHLTSLNIVERFQAIVGGDEVQRGKPAPDIFLEAGLRLGIEPEFCLVLEDSEHGIEGAKTAGMRAIRIPDGITKEEIPYSKADLMIDSLNEVIALLR